MPSTGRGVSVILCDEITPPRFALRTVKAGLGLVGLLVALAVVAGSALRGTKALTHAGQGPASAGGSTTAASGTARQQASDIRAQVHDAVGSAMNDAEARRQQAEKP